MKVNLTLKILSSSFVATLLLILLVGFTTVEMQDVSRQYRLAVAAHENAQALQELKIHLDKQLLAVRGFLLIPQNSYLQALTQGRTDVASLITGLKKGADQSTLQQLGELDTQLADLGVLIDQEIALKQQDKTQEAITLMLEVTKPLSDKVVAKVDVLMKNADDIAQAAQAHAEAQSKEAVLYSMLMAVVTVVLLLVVGYLVARMITRPVVAVAAVAWELAGGNLQVKPLLVKSRDEVGVMSDALNQAIAGLRSLVTQVQNSVNTVATSARHMQANTEQVSDVALGVAQAVSQVAQGATGQMVSVRTTRAAVEQLQAAIGQIASGAQDQAGNAQEMASIVGRVATAIDDVVVKADRVSSSAQTATRTAEHGRQVVEATSRGIGQIRTRVFQTQQQVVALGQMSVQIAEITGAITGIADQTNLLALNAAIEAARAGEHGKGFAVVADEVRKLSERAGKSAKEISGLVGSIGKSTEQVVEAMKQATVEVAEGTERAADADKALQEILAVVRQVTGDVDAIAVAAREISAANRDVVNATNSVAAVSEENTAATEEMAAGAEDMIRGVGSVATVSEENAAAAEEVSASVEEMNASVLEIAQASKNMADVAAGLQVEISRFRL
ncbi:MAG TPA: methyl-accepting chemotaxis protein [Symbiobacteriaceae bacterium]